MKPRSQLAESRSYNNVPLELVEHDGRHYLETGGRQITAAHLGHPEMELLTLLSRPFRPARKPRLIFLGLGFGQALAAARKALPQEKAEFIIFPEGPALLDQYQELIPQIVDLDDERLQFEKGGPFQQISGSFAGSQAIVLDLDALEMIAPPSWSISSEKVLYNYSETLKTGALLGLVVTRPRKELEKALRKVGFEVVTEVVPLSVKSKKSRTLYLARKGFYERGR